MFSENGLRNFIRDHYDPTQRIISLPGQKEKITASLGYHVSDTADNLIKGLREDGSYVEEFYRAITRIEKYQAELLKKEGCSSLIDYFVRKHGVSAALDMTNQRHRLKLFKIAQETKDSVSQILAIDPISDLDNPGMINTIATLFQNEDGRVYVPEISEALYTYCAIHFAEHNNIDVSMCAFRLGHHYALGKTGRIDYNASFFWFDVAMRLGHGVAPKFMHTILESEDERFGDPNEPEFNAYADSLVQKAKDMGHQFPCAAEWVDNRDTFGRGKNNDPKVVVALYEKIIEEQFLAPPQLSLLMPYAIRALLFEDTPRSYDDIVENIKSGVQRKGLQSFYTSDLEVPLRAFEKVSQKQKHSSDYASKLKTMGSWVSAYHNGRVSKKQFEDTIEKILAFGAISSIEAYRDGLYLGMMLAIEEKWDIGYDIGQAFEKAHCVCLKLDPEKLRRSAMIMGPFYNPIDPNNALPILGEHLPASKSNDEVSFQRTTLGAFVPLPGIVEIDSIVGEYEGSIIFNFKSDSVSPAFILEEDIHVAMALSFGDKEKPIWPSLSLEKKDSHILPDELKQFCVKMWNPSWLGHTDFGRTLYIVDRLAGQLTWSPRSFSVAKPGDAFDPKFPEYVRNLLEDLRFTGGADKAAQGKMINVSPEYIPLQIEKTKRFFRPEQWKVPLDTIKMRINGAYTQERDGQDIRDIGWNDTTFGQGRLTQRLTDHYSDISLMMPVFERVRQLSGLTYGLMKLRQDGFKLGKKFQDEASARLADFQNRPPLRREELVMKRPPFRLDFIG